MEEDQWGSKHQPEECGGWGRERGEATRSLAAAETRLLILAIEYNQTQKSPARTGAHGNTLPPLLRVDQNRLLSHDNERPDTIDPLSRRRDKVF